MSRSQLAADPHFEQWSDTYEQSCMQKVLFDRVHRKVLDLVPRGTSPQFILDVGCGTGRLLRAAAARWPAAQLTGVDVAEGMIARARELTPGASFHVCPAEHLPLPNASVDFALSTVSFHHWQDQRKGVCEIARVLRPNGEFILADLPLPFHGHPSSASRVRTLFADAGLAVQLQRRALGPFLLITVGVNG